MKCTALRGESGAMIDACIRLATINELHMQFDIACNNYKHREQNMYSTVSVYKPRDPTRFGIVSMALRI